MSTASENSLDDVKKIKKGLSVNRIIDELNDAVVIVPITVKLCFFAIFPGKNSSLEFPDRSNQGFIAKNILIYRTVVVPK